MVNFVEDRILVLKIGIEKSELMPIGKKNCNVFISLLSTSFGQPEHGDSFEKIFNINLKIPN